MRLPHYLLVGTMLLTACQSCKKDEADDEPPPMPTPTTTVSAEPPQTTVLTTAEPAGPGEFVRPELDNRSDGVSGKVISISGAKANFNVASDWKTKKGESTVATAADGASRLAAAKGTDPNALLEKLATANGISGCQWGGPLSLTVGKDNLSVQAADGKCKKGGADVNAAWMATEGLVIVGSWDNGADKSDMFGAMRSVAKLKVGKVGVSKLTACCQVLKQNAKSAPPPQNGFMLQAAVTCEAAARNNNLAAVNAALQQFGMQCK